MYIMNILLRLSTFAVGWLLFVGILLHAAVRDLLLSDGGNIEMDAMNSQYDPLRNQHGTTHN